MVLVGGSRRQLRKELLCKCYGIGNGNFTRVIPLVYQVFTLYI